MESDSLDSRPTWLKLWMAFAVAVLIYRLASTVTWVVLALFIDPLLVDPPLMYLAAWEDTAVTVVGVCLAVAFARWQEPYFAKKSMRINLLFAVIITLLALNPLRIDINPELVPNRSDQLF